MLDIDTMPNISNTKNNIKKILIDVLAVRNRKKYPPIFPPITIKTNAAMGFVSTATSRSHKKSKTIPKLNAMLNITISGSFIVLKIFFALLFCFCKDFAVAFFSLLNNDCFNGNPQLGQFFALLEISF